MPLKKYHHGDLKNALIQAGIEVLAKEGVSGLSLRKVASRAGVSHSAPYSHFKDKQSLIAAITTESFRQLYEELKEAIAPFSSDPKRQLTAGSLAYAQFALDHTDMFKIMFSGVLEKEKDYPAYVEATRQTFGQVVQVIQACQDAGVLRPAPPEVMAVSVWGQVHGIVSLALEGQISHTVLDRHSVRELVSLAVDQFTAA
ncbi:MAG TPA: TetR/AcrR family transcriptional regulator [Anaerolineales bacterium]|nr:TetR/AcrR family transcriptional regulator [Anaerolineales bacterium]